MALQIFEPRYLDLVSRSLKHDTGFGVTWLRAGGEVYNSDQDTRIAQIGTYAKVVDWDSLPNKLLGITVEGEKKFRVVSSFQRDDKLHMAQVEWLEPEPVLPLPADSNDLQALLARLLEHPHVERLKLAPTVNDVASLGCVLAQLLPIAEAFKFELLGIDDPLQRLDRLIAHLDEYSQ